jgi:hypothetical protein
LGTQLAGHAVADHASAHSAADDNADPSRAVPAGAEMDNDVTACNVAAAPHYLSEFGRGSDPVRRRKHVGR